MKLFAGYDGGGTKTACVLTDEYGNLLGTGVGGPSNYLYCGKEMAAASVQEATAQAFRQAGIPQTRLEGAYMASAAILIQHGDFHVPFFSTCIDADTVICESDIYPIWYGAVRDEPAVVSIAGTGAITYVCSQEQFLRVSGWGPLLGDEGSGYDLGLRALRLACRMADQRVPAEDAFLEALFAHYEVTSPRELLLVLNKGDTRSKVASAAKIVFDLYGQGSPSAQKLISSCADEIALAIQTAIEKDPSGISYPVILSGSLVRKESAICPMLEERLIYPGSRISRLCWLESHPAAAAAALALHHSGLRGAANALLENTKGVSL